MHSIIATSVNHALSRGITHLLESGVQEQSRNGPVLVAPGPVCTTYLHPQRRVLFGALRDANPFFHLFEALWMLGGREDVAFVEQFNSNIRNYSDDGTTFHGAYGFRWRRHFRFDQLAAIARMLKDDPTTRRAVLTMWSPNDDVALGFSKDLPCNTHCYFDLRGGVLNLTVCNRSNDAIWGAYGANVVQFSMLLEYMAGLLQVPMGVYRQMSNNFHVYLEKFSTGQLDELVEEGDAYAGYQAPAVPMMNVSYGHWHDDLQHFLDNPEQRDYVDPFFADLVYPIYRAWADRKAGDVTSCRYILSELKHTDWGLACWEWVARRSGTGQGA